MAGQIYDSLHGKLLTLPDEVEIYPGHTPGSVCGAGISGKPASTIGFEKRWNPMLSLDTRCLRRGADQGHPAAAGGDGSHGRGQPGDADRAVAQNVLDIARHPRQPRASSRISCSRCCSSASPSA